MICVVTVLLLIVLLIKMQTCLQLQSLVKLVLLYIRHIDTIVTIFDASTGLIKEGKKRNYREFIIYTSLHKLCAECVHLGMEIGA